jgi:hypothetical protein
VVKTLSPVVRALSALGTVDCNRLLSRVRHFLNWSVAEQAPDGSEHPAPAFVFGHACGEPIESIKTVTPTSR